MKKSVAFMDIWYIIMEICMTEMMTDLLLSCLVGAGVFFVLLFIGRIFARPNYKGVADPKRQWKRIVITDMLVTSAYFIFCIIEIILYFKTKDILFLIQVLLSLLIAVPSLWMLNKYKNKKKKIAFSDKNNEIEEGEYEGSKSFFLINIIELIVDFFWNLFD